jgi:hypothetical protein
MVKHCNESMTRLPGPFFGSEIWYCYVCKNTYRVHCEELMRIHDNTFLGPIAAHCGVCDYSQKLIK